uniref:ABC1 atypical kinase-like domain-containing protein n=1 Tax=Chromera velia CCMP2878 TaxID=1169474 RepID=A0A0G4H610_9ALVE|eukprot:Cvel_5756.t1-p1 / transcript=Cvel_5756.t1 / gene=Cvel_5756 / organism=Chromera_velia_CCMP2878 / gene_product=Chaperone activity of bc1 complex-like,, putative / transcript_product=Chaperone activity of bc1 complex-like,, putative / location=Cvel_scaffold273:69900-74785(-) / protein_length=720 / sequence_SO=supercontig / SO=protein_coding / is_pseudo=false
MEHAPLITNWNRQLGGSQVCQTTSSKNQTEIGGKVEEGVATATSRQPTEQTNTTPEVPPDTDFEAGLKEEMTPEKAVELLKLLGSQKGPSRKLLQLLRTFTELLPSFETLDVLFSHPFLREFDELKDGLQEFLEAVHEQITPTLLKYCKPPQKIPASQLHGLIEEELGEHWRDRFTYFEEEPFAVSSIAQGGHKVAMKVRYPNVEETGEKDIETLRRLLKALILNDPDHLLIEDDGDNKSDSEDKSAKADKSDCDDSESVDWIEQAVLRYMDALCDQLAKEWAEECNYLKETENQQKYREAINDYEQSTAATRGTREPVLSVPFVVTDLTTTRVLTSEFGEGIPLEEVSEKLPSSVCLSIVRSLFRLLTVELTHTKMMKPDVNLGDFVYCPQTNRLFILDFGATVTDQMHDFSNELLSFAKGMKNVKDESARVLFTLQQWKMIDFSQTLPGAQWIAYQVAAVADMLKLFSDLNCFYDRGALIECRRTLLDAFETAPLPASNDPFLIAGAPTPPPSWDVKELFEKVIEHERQRWEKEEELKAEKKKEKEETLHQRVAEVQAAMEREEMKQKTAFEDWKKRLDQAMERELEVEVGRRTGTQDNPNESLNLVLNSPPTFGNHAHLQTQTATVTQNRNAKTLPDVSNGVKVRALISNSRRMFTAAAASSSPPATVATTGFQDTTNQAQRHSNVLPPAASAAAGAGASSTATPAVTRAVPSVDSA